MADPVGLVVLDLDVLVPLGMDEQLLGALLVLHADLVEVGRRSLAPPSKTIVESSEMNVRE